MKLLVLVVLNRGISPGASSTCPLPVMGTHYAGAETDRDGERKRDVNCTMQEALPLEKVFQSAM